MTEKPEREPGMEQNSGSGKSIARVAVLVAVLALMAVALKYTGLGYYFSRPFIEGVLDRMGLWAPFGFLLIYTTGTVMMVPGTILTALGGAVFGPVMGTALVVAGATAGAAAAFFTSRFVARDYILARFSGSPWFKKLEEGIAAKGIRFVLFVRLVPVFPFNWLNYACGLTGVGFKDYLIGTFFGIMPASFVFTNAAAELTHAAAGEGIGLSFYLSLTLLGLFAAGSMLYKGDDEKPKQTPNEDAKGGEL